jgi:membrane protease YdiL (CAAX protease family)
MGYIGQPPHSALMLCLLQYIPAGLCLCWAYERSGSLLAAILVHAATNAAVFWL